MKLNGLRDWGNAQSKTVVDKGMARASDRINAQKGKIDVEKREEFQYKLLVGSTVISAFLALALVVLIGVSSFHRFFP